MVKAGTEEREEWEEEDSESGHGSENVNGTTPRERTQKPVARSEKSLRRWMH